MSRTQYATSLVHNRGGTTSEPLYVMDKYPVYQIDFTSAATGKSISLSKRRIRWRFGFVSHEAMDAGLTGPECRGEEHEVVLVWSVTSGKRLIMVDGQEVHYSNSKEQKFQFTWTMRGNHTAKVVAHAMPGLLSKSDFKQFDFTLDGCSYFDFAKIFELGKSRKGGGGQAGADTYEPYGGGYHNYSYEQQQPSRYCNYAHDENLDFATGVDNRRSSRNNYDDDYARRSRAIEYNTTQMNETSIPPVVAVHPQQQEYSQNSYPDTAQLTQEEKDYRLALALQEQENRLASSHSNTARPPSSAQPTTSLVSRTTGLPIAYDYRQPQTSIRQLEYGQVAAPPAPMAQTHPLMASQTTQIQQPPPPAQMQQSFPSSQMQQSLPPAPPVVEEKQDLLDFAFDTNSSVMAYTSGNSQHHNDLLGMESAPVHDPFSSPPPQAVYSQQPQQPAIPYKSHINDIMYAYNNTAVNSNSQNNTSIPATPVVQSLPDKPNEKQQQDSSSTLPKNYNFNQKYTGDETEPIDDLSRGVKALVNLDDITDANAATQLLMNKPLDNKGKSKGLPPSMLQPSLQEMQSIRRKDPPKSEIMKNNSSATANNAAAMVVYGAGPPLLNQNEQMRRGVGFGAGLGQGYANAR